MHLQDWMWYAFQYKAASTPKLDLHMKLIDITLFGNFGAKNRAFLN